MKLIASRFLLIITCLGIAGISCSKSETSAGKPTIELMADEGFLTKDTFATESSTLRFRLHCKWNGEQTLTNLIVADNGTRVVDEGMNIKEFVKDVAFAKSVSDVDSVAFTIRDIEGNSSFKSLRVQKKSGSSGGELLRYNEIVLDAQNAVDGKSFLSLTNGMAYSLQDAYGVQQKINMLYYYDSASGEDNLFASPGANIDASIFSGSYGLPSWTTKNTTRFYQISLTQPEFEAITNPVFVVNSYSESLGKRKAKNLTAGDAYAFKVENTGKYGILRVSKVIGQDAGKVVFSIVMQK